MSEKKGRAQIKRKEKPRSGEIVPWRPSDFLKEMDQMFNDFHRAFGSVMAPLKEWMPRIGFPPSGLKEPDTDIIDKGNEYFVRAEIPGIPKEKIDVSINPKTIEISAEAETKTKEEKENYIKQERSYSKVYRNLVFPEEVIPDKAEATLNNGILEVKIPKKTPTEIKKQKIPVK